MSTASTQTAPALRFRLSTLFILFTCLAIGLATTRDLLTAAWTAMQAAMVIGLLQQTRELLRWQPELGASDGSWPARTFAITWRVTVAAAIALYLAIELTDWGNGWRYPDRENLFFYEPVDVIFLLLPTFVLANSVRRWRPSGTLGSSRRVGWWITVVALMALAACNVIDAQLTDYLVHSATAGIEASITPKFQRPGVYPNHANEGFRSFWTVFAVAASVPLGAAFLVGASNRWKSARRKLLGAGFVLCLAAQVLFCAWFYNDEYPRVSPDLAGAGFAADGDDLLAILILIAVVTVPTAYFLTADSRQQILVSDNLAVDLESRSIHESGPFLIVLVVSGALNLITSLISTFGQLTLLSSKMPVNPSMQKWMNFSILISPLLLLVIVPSLLALQLGYYRWKQRQRTVSWQLFALPRAKFALYWLAVTVAILVGVPTLAAFGFMFWLGPLNFSGI